MTGFEPGLNAVQLARKISEATKDPEAAKALYDKYNVVYNEDGVNYSTLANAMATDYVYNESGLSDAMDKVALISEATGHAVNFDDGTENPDDYDEDGIPKKSDPESTPGSDQPSSLPADTELTRNATSGEVKEVIGEMLKQVGTADETGKISALALSRWDDRNIDATIEAYVNENPDKIPPNVNVDDLKARAKTATREARDNAQSYMSRPTDTRKEDESDFNPYRGVTFNDKDPSSIAKPDEGKKDIDNDSPTTAEKDKGKGQGVNDLGSVTIHGRTIYVWKDNDGNIHRSTKKPDVPAAGTDPGIEENPSSTGGDTEKPEEQDPVPEKNTTPDPDAGLTTFERVGIKADRHLATRPASEWQHSPAVTKDAPHKFNCLAQAINDSLKEEQQTPTGPRKTSPATLGFTNRAIPEHLDKSFLEQVVEMAFETSGAGGFDTQVAQVFAKHDRFNRSLAPKNAVFSGYTFFTRPRLCLRDWNICHDRKLAPLMTLDTQSIDFAIRCLLDTRFAHENENAGKTKLFDKMNPFNVPLCNAVRSVTGFNDPMLVTETTEGGFFSEDQTYVIGGDRMAKTYDINCMFRDYPGSPILAMIDFWTQYMAGLTDGSLQQYADAIDLNRMDYTVSIYRFLMDRTNRNIVRWAKCTGCYPVSTPSGVCFNLNESEFMIDAAASINVPFKANRIEYDDPVILKEFNMLVRRYAGEETGLTTSYAGYSKMTPEEKEKQDQQFIAGFQHNVASNNFSGIPYIRMSPSGGYELIWLRRDIVGEYILGDVGAMTGIRTQTADKRETIKYRGSVHGDSDEDIRFLI